MTSRPAGWYDDPEDPGQLRYWDGILWTSHVTPRRTIDPTPTIDPVPAADAASAGSASAFPASGGPGRAQYGNVPGSGSPYGQWPYTAAGTGTGTGTGTGAYPARWVTVDGVPLAGWWRRVLAFVIDALVCWCLVVPLTYGLLQDSMTALNAWVESFIAAFNAGGAPPEIPSDVTSSFVTIGLLFAVVGAVYEILLLTRTGQTVGRWATGTSVRLVERPGPPSLAVATRRTLVKHADRLLSGVALLGTFASLFGIVDVLWPLWDKRRQAIHDLAAGTQVVLGRQPRDR